MKEKFLLHNLLKEILDYSYFVTNLEKLKMLPNILRLLSGEKTMKGLDNTSITETIKKYAA